MRIPILFGFLLATVFGFSSPTNVYAHQSGASWEKIVGGYEVDIGYDPTIFVAGESVRFDFNAIDVATGESADFSDVWVRITRDKETVFASGIYKQDLGGAGMTWEFPKAGDYTLNVRFENADKNLVEATFPMAVGAARDAAIPVSSIIGTVIGFLVGAVSTWLVSKKLKGLA